MTLLRIGFTDDGKRALERARARPAQVRKRLTSALRQGLTEAAEHLRANYMRGGSPSVPRGGKPPLAVRSGALIGSVQSEVDQPLSGYVGVVEGPATKYAAMQLGGGTTTIKPVNARHLWIPVGDNLTPSGLMRTSPREAMEKTTRTGKRLLRIFRSRSGNLVAFMPEAAEATDVTGDRVSLTTGARFRRGARKGQLKGKLLFVLKDQVSVKGTDALATAVQERTDRIGQLVNEALAGDGGEE